MRVVVGCAIAAPAAARLLPLELGWSSCRSGGSQMLLLIEMLLLGEMQLLERVIRLGRMLPLVEVRMGVGMRMGLRMNMRMVVVLGVGQLPLLRQSGSSRWCWDVAAAAPAAARCFATFRFCNLISTVYTQQTV